MSRVDRQAETYLTERLAYLRTTLNDLKQAQTFGASDVRTYYVTTGKVDITLAAVTTTTPRCVEVTLTPNTAASNPVIAYDLAFQASSSVGSSIYNTLQVVPPVNGVQKFRLTITSGDSTKDIGLAFAFWTISPGTYTCAEVTP